MLGSRGRHLRALLPLLCLLLVSASVPAQLPDTGSSGSHYNANVIPEQGSASISYLGSATIPVTVEDVSVDPTGEQNEPREVNQIRLSADVLGNNSAGWVASLSKMQLSTQAGQTHQLRLNVQVGATVEDPTVEVRIQAVYRAASGEESVTNASVMAVAESFPRLNMQMGALPDTFQPDEMQRIPITVTNRDYYPDMVSFRVTGPDGWLVSPPSSIRLGPGETKTVYIDAKAPQNPWFRYTTKSDLVNVRAVSETSGQPLVTVGVPVTQSGSTLPAWVGPHLLVLLIGAGVIVSRTRRRLKERGLEKGKPSYPGLDPEHEAELEALKITDSEDAEVVEDRLSILYEQRKEAWKEAYEKRQQTEEELREAYEERHEALIEAREVDREPSRDELERRRELLETKKRLLERKRQSRRDETDDERPEGSSS